MSSKNIVVAVLAVTGALLAAGAQARDNDGPRVSIGIAAPFGLPGLPPLPAIGLPHPVFVQPAFDRRHLPQERVQYRQPTRFDVDGDGIPNRYDRVYNPRWDRDGDGVPNRHDPVYNPRWDRDGDGIPNRHDPVYNPRSDRDGDGIPNRYDRRDGGFNGRGGR